MKISYNWLKDYIECGLTPQQVADALTSIGLEVDSIETVEEIPGGLEGVIVAEVVAAPLTLRPDRRSCLLRWVLSSERISRSRSRGSGEWTHSV